MHNFSSFQSSNLPIHIQQRMTGFTLLEVMVALTITGLALGSLFGIIAGSKQLAWRSEQVLLEVAHVRSLINASQLNDERGQTDLELSNDSLSLLTGETFEIPERKTEDSLFALRKYEIQDENGATVVAGSYWVELDFPE